MNERAFYNETQTTKTITLNCPFCRSSDTYQLPWLVCKKKDRLPQGAGDEDRVRFQKAQSYMVLLEERVACKNLRCRKRFEVSGIKTVAFLYSDAGLPRED